MWRAMHALIRLRPHRNRAFPSSQTLASDHKFTAPSSCSSPGPLFPSGSLHASSASWPPFFRPFSPTSPLCPRAFHPFLNHGSHGCPKFSPSRCVMSVGASSEPVRQGCRKQAQERHACTPAQFILTHPLTGLSFLAGTDAGVKRTLDDADAVHEVVFLTVCNAMCVCDALHDGGHCMIVSTQRLPTLTLHVRTRKPFGASFPGLGWETAGTGRTGGFWGEPKHGSQNACG